MSTSQQRRDDREHAWRLLGYNHGRIARAMSHTVLDILRRLGLNRGEDQRIRRIIDELGGDQ